jgi:hypothetical protein
MTRLDTLDETARRRNRSPGSDWLVLVALVLLLAVALWASARSAGTMVPVPTERGGLTRPIRLEWVRPGAAQELLLGLRVHHYRVQPLGEADYVDYFYDTPDWALYRHGYSYRLRVRTGEGAETPYAVRLEQEPRFVPAGETKLDLRSDLPEPLGEAIAGGAWEGAVLRGGGLEAPQRLRDLLSDLGLDAGSLEPRLRAELHRERFDVTDKGQSWFELDSEQWTFGLTGPAFVGVAVELQNFVLDTRLPRSHPELLRRVQTMVMLSEMFHATRPTELAPHEQAILRLAPAAG